MNEEILKAIRDSLPSIQAKELSNFFDKYGEIEKENKDIKNTNKSLEEKNKKLEDIDRKNYDLEQREKLLAEEKAKFEKEQRDAKIKELEMQVSYEQAGNKKVIDMLNVIFKNRFFNKSINGYKPEGSVSSTEFINEQEI